MKKYCFIFMFFWISCDQRQDIEKPVEKSKPQKDSLVATMLGDWGGDTGDPVWGIRKDLIHYYEEKTSYYYLVQGKDVIVLYKTGPYLMGNIHVQGDTLFFTNEYGGVI